ncbi:competence protein CoiA family protein [Burkholderia arboris]|uniref:competence protein CoiA family protein n=1 Tax=Burkholderia arboris TaxID=488730 RepID=UPI001CF54004|nr:competence protein CoiA family protein [Burkholderia arboris]MCA8494019.1 hypothetical protein [Burkholderia arboris]
MTIPFALNPLGRLVAARDLPKHAEGPFLCAACRSPVILKQGEVMTWHFAHRPGPDCASGFETALHLLAKQILLEHRHLRVPALVCVDESSLDEDITVCNERTMRWDAPGEVEKWMDGIRPDFVVDCGDHLLIVEVVVTHKPDDNKLAQLDRLAMPALAIDLSDVARDVTVDTLMHRILDTVVAKRWLVYPGWAEAQAQLDARLADEEAECAAERARERAQERREHDLARPEQAAEMARQEAIRSKREAANERFRQASDAEKQAFLAWKLGLAEREWPPVFGSPVRGAAAVPARAWIWQADVFRKFIQGQRSLRSAPALSVEVVAEWLIQRYAVLPTASTSLRVAVWEFLCLLETHGYLRRRVRQEFEILKDSLIAPGQLEPTHTLHPAAAATRGLFWSRNFVDQEQLYLAAEQTGVRLPHDVMRRLKGRHSPAGAPLSEAEYTHSVSVALRLPLEQTVEFLTAAGFFVRI